MKIYILTDIEGAAGVNRWNQTIDECEAKTRAMSLLTGEVNAAVDGILDADPEAQIVVWDGHGHGGLIYEELHSAAQLIPRGVYNFETRNYAVDASYGAMFFVGQHAMAGTQGGPLCHTYSSATITHYKLNGELMGEFGCRAAVAGSLGVPTIFLSGDDKACEEARALVPEIETAAVKKGLGVELALHLSKERARELIREGAKRAMKRLGEIPPFIVPPPYELEVRVNEGCSLEPYLNIGFTRVDERTVVKRSEVMSGLHI